MDFFFSVGNIIIGLFLALIGFKVYNPFKGKNQPEKEEEWYNKFGTIFKVIGIGILIFGIIKTLGS